MAAYYNENDKKAAAWLRELIRAREIAWGIVDERDIRDVLPADLHGFTQCHFFAGIGGWSDALRLAAWPDDREAWTGSCPCQPFSAAGAGGGFADERHLWPHFLHLIQHAKPRHVPVFGEQVAGKAGRAWLDLVRGDVAATGHAFWAADLAAASVGAPHIRQRHFWVAYHDDDGRPAWPVSDHAGPPGPTRGGLGHTGRPGLEVERGPAGVPRGASAADAGQAAERADARVAVGVADSPLGRRGEERADVGWLAAGDPTQGVAAGLGAGRGRSGPWSDCDWLPCRDGVWRPTQPGLQPLAHGVPARVVRLRGYGNAILPPLAAEFIGAYLDAMTHD